MGACTSNAAAASAGGSARTATVAPLIHQIAFLGTAQAGKPEVLRHIMGRIADIGETAKRSKDSAVQSMADAWSVATKKVGEPDFFGSPTFNVKVSGLPLSFHDVPHDKWRSGSEDAVGYLWVMSGAVLVLDARAPDLMAAARSSVDQTLEARVPLLVILNHVERNKAAAAAALASFAKNFGLEVSPLQNEHWAVDIHFAYEGKQGDGEGSPGTSSAGATVTWCCGEGWPTTVPSPSGEKAEGGKDAVVVAAKDTPDCLKEEGRILTTFPPPVYVEHLSAGAPPGAPELCKGLNWLLKTVAQHSKF